MICPDLDVERFREAWMPSVSGAIGILLESVVYTILVAAVVWLIYIVAFVVIVGWLL